MKTRFSLAAGFLILISSIEICLAYYSHFKVFGTGDTLITTTYYGGGTLLENERWLIECNDGEGMVGIYDTTHQFVGISQVWCYFLFPKKPPSNGIYPFYSGCNVRNFTAYHEFYCYDKLWPADTTDTFVTGLYSAVSLDPVVPNLMKCKTPSGYRLDYNRCQWKYTHDKAGEHYDGYWVTKCDTNFVMTGMGKAMNPWEGQEHFTYIQCCPVISVGRMLDISQEL
ncbi:uncharacterized protein LOC129594673 isoform X2 [Paramacrobiotus metropolitanus]|uniref:uncharacterized protein LOC129594673 isoform X2 n=1 Tax=Paramacrobiotus metropolitanus TaxID=2943436 RepID=UPI0024458A5D|nr:uncharacterized protein LOC129594673 isoform X2 [Paramacrobiotus metropolitanus]